MCSRFLWPAARRDVDPKTEFTACPCFLLSPDKSPFGFYCPVTNLPEDGRVGTKLGYELFYVFSNVVTPVLKFGGGWVYPQLIGKLSNVSPVLRPVTTLPAAGRRRGKQRCPRLCNLRAGLCSSRPVTTLPEVGGTRERGGSKLINS
jgi:hypothetical protein